MGIFAMKNYVYLFILFAVTGLTACKTKVDDRTTKVIIRSRLFNGDRLFLETIPYNNEESKIVDSTTIIHNPDSIVFTIPESEQRLYQLRLSSKPYKVILINDSKRIEVNVNFFIGKSTLKGSQASLSVKNLINDQTIVGTRSRKIFGNLDSVKKINGDKNLINKLQNSYDSVMNTFFKNYITYADTVKSPAAFMLAYNNIDYGNDYNGLKKFINHASHRFADYKPIQLTAKEALATAKIYEEEYNIGDVLPPISLYDQNNIPFSTARLKGKYYLIDFWTTYCNQCLPFKAIQAKAFNKFPINKFEMVSVAIDDERDVWNKMIMTNNFHWTQLIDEKMWKGPTVNTLKFDSIPYNFLVAPNGKIIAKALNSKNALKILSEKIK
jgi:thiol-disulfide isomerase/thioredoxin